MKRWYKPELKEFDVNELVKEISVNASSGGSGVTKPDNSCKTILAGCNYSLNCDKAFIL